ncbi:MULTISPECIES: tRNA-dependent cyclodipeptide synthase [Kordiimonas]|jgi:cyclo(L-tyrosyl-L-tyrosyl) synthase|uniref:tRNA-dependent cyclodipeptide synthase n=1 Tax=Kordiimonas TaxID=288021 RepID=UPI00257CAC54|nr:tRNA-dependent cyclodipeptide synthase [Kordiimonas sp. UBA4487]
MQPVSKACAAIYAERQHAVIGVSPFNSYFSEERLRALFTWANETFEAFHIFVPDTATRYTLEAVGYDPVRAKKKARRQCRYLLNKIERAIAYTAPELDMSIVLTGDILGANNRYQSLLAHVERKFASDADFKRQCLECSHWVLENQVEDVNSIDDSALMHAVKYLLAEMPLFMDSASIIGVSSSVFCYHQCPAILRALYEDRSDGLIDEQQGFLIVDEIALAAQAA